MGDKLRGGTTIAGNIAWHFGNLFKLSQLTNDLGYVTTANLPIPALITSTTPTGITNVLTTNTNTYLNIVFNGVATGTSTQVTGVGSVSVASETNGKLTITGTTYTLAGLGGLPLAGGIMTGVIDLNRNSGGANTGLAWWTGTYKTWRTYMSTVGAGQGPVGITPPVGQLVTTYALRNYIEDIAGYGWTFEAGAAQSTTPTIKAEIRSSDGAARFGSVSVYGGTANKFLKADGTLDNSTYIPNTGGSFIDESGNTLFIDGSGIRINAAGAEMIINNKSIRYKTSIKNFNLINISDDENYINVGSKEGPLPNWKKLVLSFKEGANPERTLLMNSNGELCSVLGLPMLNTHVANAITSTNITNWNTAFNNNHTHDNKAFLDTINQNLGINYSPTFQHLNLTGNLNAGGLTLGDTAGRLRLNRQASNEIGILNENNGWADMRGNNFITTTYGDASQWKQAFNWGNHAGLYSPINHSHTFASITDKPTTIAGYGITDSFKSLKFVANLDVVSESGIYRQEGPANAYSFSPTLNLNSSDGRAQLMMNRSGSGMMYRTSTSATTGTSWTPWITVFDTSNLNPQLFLNKNTDNVVDASTFKISNSIGPNFGKFEFISDYPAMTYGDARFFISDESKAEFNDLMIIQDCLYGSNTLSLETYFTNNSKIHFINTLKGSGSSRVSVYNDNYGLGVDFDGVNFFSINSNSLIFGGPTAKAIINNNVLTVNRNYGLPDKSGTIALLDDISNVDISSKVDKTTKVNAGNGLTGGGALGSDVTLTLGLPTSLTATTTNNLTTTSHTHAITTTSVGAINTIVQTNANGAIGTSRFGSFGLYNAAQTQAIWGMGAAYTVNASTTNLGTLYGLGYSNVSVGGSSLAGKHQIHFAHAGTAKVSINLDNGEVRASQFTVISGTASQFLKANGTVDTNQYLPLATDSAAVFGASYITNTEAPAGSRMKIILPFGPVTNTMVAFTIRVYGSYTYYDLVVSGYVYAGVNQWYLPRVQMISSQGQVTSIGVHFGRNPDNKLYVSIPRLNYMGVGIFDIVGGFTPANWGTGWAIIEDSTLPNLFQIEPFLAFDDKINTTTNQSVGGIKNFSILRQNGHDVASAGNTIIESISSTLRLSVGSTIASTTTVMGITSNNQSLITDTWGNHAGFINIPGVDNGSPTQDWSHRIKMLHNNSAGYYTEIAVQMTGTPGMYYKQFQGGVNSGWIKLSDEKTTVTLDTSQTITARKIFGGGTGNTYNTSGIEIRQSNASLIPTLSFHHPTNGYAGTIGLNSGTFEFKNASSVFIPLAASAFYESSLREFKTNIKPFERSGLELIDGLEIVTFDRKDSELKDKIGVIADDTSDEFLSENKDAVDLYKTIFIQAKAIQELSQENRILREELHNLRELVMSKLNQI